MRGFNALQHQNVAWDDPKAHRSLKRMAALGANAIVFIPFLQQSASDSTVVEISNAVTGTQLQSGIRYARKLGLHITLKPQMLITGSWAGAIDQPDSIRWQQWFESYSRQIVEQAKFAQQEQVQAFVIGTELVKARQHVAWPELIKRVRQVFSGQLTYAAHNVEGVRLFPHWQLLDAVALTLYPSLGSSGEKQEMQKYVNETLAELHDAVRAINRPLWVMEVGMPSAQGASSKPWEWHALHHAKADMILQRDALDIWLKALDQPWINGVFIWVWYSDFSSGGRNNADYTPQNKPAESVIRRFWDI